MRLSRLFQLLLIAGLLLFMVSCDQKKSRKSPSFETKKERQDFLRDYFLDIPDKDQIIQNLSYKLLDGTKSDLESKRGKILFLNFWATWCVPCKAEMPDMEFLHKELNQYNFSIVAISYGEKKEQVISFLKKYPYSFDIALDETAALGRAIGIEGLPTTFIIAKDGQVLGKAVGPRRWKDKKFVNFLKQISK